MGNLEAVTIAKQKVKIENPQKLMCVYLIVTKAILVSVCPVLSYSTSVRSAILIRSRVEYDRDREYAVP